MKVITGGQTGVDQGAWRAAKAAGLETGGWMPKGFKTEDGPRPEFAALYGAIEHTSPRYEDRTPLNVGDADVTILIGDWTSRGSKLAYRCFREKIGEKGSGRGRDPGICYIRERGWIPVYRWVTSGTLNLEADSVIRVLRSQPHGVVNVAGNRESAKPGIGAWTEAFLLPIFREFANEDAS